MQQTVTYHLCDRCGQRAEPHVTARAVTDHSPASGVYTSDEVDLCQQCACVLLPGVVRGLTHAQARDFIDSATPARGRLPS